MAPIAFVNAFTVSVSKHFFEDPSLLYSILKQIVKFVKVPPKYVILTKYGLK